MSNDPRNKREEEIFAVERFRVGVQHRLQKLMNAKGMSQKDLAEAMRLSEARVSQIFASQCNLTIRVLARMLFALDEEGELSSPTLVKLDASQETRPSWELEPSTTPVPEHETGMARVYSIPRNTSSKSGYAYEDGDADMEFDDRTALFG